MSLWPFKKPVEPGIVLSSIGHCPTCNKPSEFIARDAWLRDHFLCANCGSIPRERALMHVIETLYPNWRELAIHESSPSPRGASLRLKNECKNYNATQFFPDVSSGQSKDGIRCENLEALTFADAMFDLHVTQDVMEHLFDPAATFREIARTLKPGGAHIFTVPIVNRHQPSRVRARRSAAGAIEHLETPAYHGNPISEEGVLVTMDWGFDICRTIHEACGLFTQTFVIDDLSRGIRAELIEVLATSKVGHE